MRVDRIVLINMNVRVTFAHKSLSFRLMSGEAVAAAPPDLLPDHTRGRDRDGYIIQYAPTFFPPLLLHSFASFHRFFCFKGNY